jgi:hypothetical protein
MHSIVLYLIPPSYLCREIGNREGAAVSLAIMAYYAGQLGDTERKKELNLQAAEVLESIGD